MLRRSVNAMNLTCLCFHKSVASGGFIHRVPPFSWPLIDRRYRKTECYIHRRSAKEEVQIFLMIPNPKSLRVITYGRSCQGHCEEFQGRWLDFREPYNLLIAQKRAPEFR